MKNIVKMSLALALAVPFTFACSKEGGSSTANASGKVSAAEVTKGATEAAKGATDAAKAKSEEMKAAFAKATEGSMGDVSKQIDEIKKKAEALTGEKKTEFDALVKSIVAKKDELAKMFTDMKGMTEGPAFTEMKGKLEMGMADLKTMVETAMAKLK